MSAYAIAIKEYFIVLMVFYVFGKLRMNGLRCYYNGEQRANSAKQMGGWFSP